MLMKNLTSSILFVLLLVFCSVGYCSEEQTYTITETQLQELENNLTALENINQMLLETLSTSEMESSKILKESIEQKKELITLRNQLSEYKNRMEISMTQLEKAQKELDNLAKSLKTLEKDKNRAVKQRDILGTIAGTLAIILAFKC